MIGFLRFVGLMNGAVWFGATVFFLVGAMPALTSKELAALIGSNNFPVYSVSIAQIVATRYFHLYLVCSLIALLHLIGEWLYLGNYPPKRWVGMVCGLCFLGLLQAFWIQPMLRDLHHLQFGRQTRLEQREAAARAVRFWRAVSTSFTVLVLGGLGVYVWRVGNPPDSMRFVRASKFRS